MPQQSSSVKPTWGSKMKLLVKIGTGTLNKPMTEKQAKTYGDKNMPDDLKKAGFITTVSLSDADLHGGLWYRVNYTKGASK